VLEENVVADVTVTGGWAIGVSDSNESQVAGNLVSNIRGSGIGAGSGEGNVIAHNTIRGAETGISLGATGTDVRANVVTGGATGMYIISADGNQIVENTLTGGSFTGIYVGFSERNRFAHNRIARYEGLGVHIIEAAHENRFERNTITRNGGGLAILPRPGMNFGASHGNLLAGNWITRNGGDGILVQRENTATLVRGNHANRNADDGVDVEDPTASLARNKANHNGDLGIEAVSGVTDGGRNKARRNGNPLQCLNVSC
jgi:parallel beta-helix repeat protein